MLLFFFVAGVSGLHQSMGDGRPSFLDTHVHRLAVGVVGPLWHHQQRAWHSGQRGRGLVSARLKARRL